MSNVTGQKVLSSVCNDAELDMSKLIKISLLQFGIGPEIDMY